MKLRFTFCSPLRHTCASELTNDLETPISVELSNVACVKPPLTVLVNFEVFLCFARVLKVPLTDVGAPNHHLSTWVRLVSDRVASWEETRIQWNSIALFTRYKLTRVRPGLKLTRVSFCRVNTANSGSTRVSLSCKHY